MRALSSQTRRAFNRSRRERSRRERSRRSHQRAAKAQLTEPIPWLNA